MQIVNRQFKRGPNQFIVRGSYGELLVDIETGNVVAYFPDEGTDPSEGYGNIYRFDVPRYKTQNGTPDELDILDIGYWNNDGTYEPTELE